MRQLKNFFLLTSTILLATACNSDNKTEIPKMPEDLASAPPPPFRYEKNPSKLFSNATADYTCMVNDLKKSEIKCWGDNSSAQVSGNGKATPTAGVTIIPGLPDSDVVTMSVGASHACALFDDKSLWCWGSNAQGQISPHLDKAPLYKPVKINTETSALGSEDILLISAGYNHTCAATEFDTVFCWGNNTDGQVSANGTTEVVSDFTEVSGIPSNGIVKLSSSYNYSCAAYMKDGVWCWGRNNLGQVSGEPNDTLPNSDDLPIVGKLTQVSGLPSNKVANLALGYDHACANLTDGHTWCWGNDQNAQVSAIRRTSTMSPGLTLVQGLPQLPAFAINVVAGQNFTCANFTNNTLWCWGTNARGVIDGNGKVGSLAQRLTQNVSTIKNVILTTGNKHACISMEKTGLVKCWGDNTKSQSIDNGFATNGIKAPTNIELNLPEMPAPK